MGKAKDTKHTSPEYSRAYYVKNRAKLIAQTVAWRKANPSRAKAAQKRYRSRAAAADPVTWKRKVRDRNLRVKYGISAAEYDRRLADQGGRCAMCSTTDPGNRWGVFVVDHDHSTGAVRALLCGPCNGSLGHYEKVRLLAEAYLRRFNAD